MSVFWFAAGTLVLVPLLIIQQRRISELRRNRQEPPGRDACLLVAQALVECMPWPAFFKGQDGRYRGCNSAFAEYLGRPRDQIIGQTAYDVLPKALADRCAAAESAMCGQPGRQLHEVKMPLADGTLLDVAIHEATFAGTDGAVGGVIGVITDSSEHKRVEEALRASEQEFHNLANNLPDNVARYDRHGRCVYLNRQLEQVLGVEMRDVLGKTLLEAFSDRVDGGYLNCLEAVLETGESAEIDIVWPDVGKGLRYHNVRFVAERGPKGEIVGALAIGRDVTERHEILRQLEIRSAALDVSNDAVFLIDEMLRFVFVNETACRSTGYSEDELLTMGLFDIDPDISPEVLQAMVAVVNAMASRGEIAKFETRHRTKDGRVFPVEIGGGLFKHEGKTFALSVVRDLSERKRLEDALRFVAQRGWQEDSKNFFDALVRYLGQTPGMDYAMIVKLGEKPRSGETVAFYAKGAIVPNIRYELAGTPCDHVMGLNYCCYPSRVQQSFPEDSLLVEMGAESYAGIPLWDSFGQPLGLIALLGCEPVSDEAWVAQLLQIVAPRAAAELERARSDALLRAREREFRSLAESSPDNIIRYDRDGRVVYLNSQLIRDLGNPLPADIIGRLPSESWPDQRSAHVERAVMQAIKTATDVTIEFDMCLPSGEQVCHQIRIVPERDDGGAVNGAIAFGRDITELKRYHQELSARELEFRSLAENAPDNIVRFDRQGRILYVNPPLARTLKVAARDVVGKMPQEIIPTWDMAPLASVVETGQTVEMDFTAPSDLGELRQYQIRLAAERGREGDIIGVLGIGRDVTRRKRAERELLILSRAINDASDSIFLINEQHRFTYVNDQACRSLGYSRKDLLTMGPADIDADIPREELERMSADFFACGWQLGRLKTRHRTADGRVIPVEISASLVEYENERMALVVACDISERKRAERELLILGSAINNASESIFLINEQLRFTYVNDRACHVLGYSRDDLLTMSPADLDIDISREDMVNMRANLLTQWPLIRTQTRARIADGTAIFVEFTASLVEYENERMALVVARDITERRRMENALRLREEEFRSLAENMPDIVKRHDLECRCVYVNPAYLREVEVPALEVLMAVPDARHWRSSSMSVDEYKARLLRVMSTGEPAELVMDWTRKSDGVTAEYAIRLVAERGADGRVIGALCIGRNVTKLMESERRLEESRQQLRDLAARREDAREEERRHIAREIHDELGQQLSALRFNLTLLAFEFGEAQPRIQEAVDKLLSLVSKTIQTTREVSSALRPVVLDLGVVPALEWLVAEFSMHGDVSFELKGGPDDVDMNDACMVVVFRIVQESLTNAVRHSKADRIEVVLGREADAYVVEVSDNGVGFDLDAPRDRRSVGLVGIRERALAVGGELVICSSPGQGTVLRVRIPAEGNQRRDRDSIVDGG